MYKLQINSLTVLVLRTVHSVLIKICMHEATHDDINSMRSNIEAILRDIRVINA